jgi:hypothetical protein
MGGAISFSPSDSAAVCIEHADIILGLCGRCVYSSLTLQDSSSSYIQRTRSALKADPVCRSAGILPLFYTIPLGADTDAEHMVLLEAVMRVLSANGLRVFGQGAQPTGAPVSVFAVRQLEVGAFVVDKHGFRRSAAAASRAQARVGSKPQSSPAPARAAAAGPSQLPASRNPPPQPSSGEGFTRPIGSVPLPPPSAIAATFSQPVRNPAGGGQPAPAAPESRRAFGIRQDVRQALAMHRALHKFWDKYKVVLSDAWLKMQQQVRRPCVHTRQQSASHVRQVRRNMWITVHPQAPESPQFPFFINDRGQPEDVHGIALICPEICIENIIRDSNMPALMDACAHPSIGSVAATSLSHVRSVAHMLKQDNAEEGLHFHISSHLFGRKVFLRSGEEAAGAVRAAEFENLMIRLISLLQTCILTADEFRTEFRTEFLKKSAPSKLLGTIMGCVTCGVYEQEDGRPLLEFCSVCKCAYYCSAQHKADDARNHIRRRPKCAAAFHDCAADAPTAAAAAAAAAAPAAPGGGVRAHPPPSAPSPLASLFAAPPAASSGAAAPKAVQSASISRQQLLDVIRSIESEDPHYFRSELRAHARLLAAVCDRTGWKLELKRIKSIMHEYVPLPLQREQGAGDGCASEEHGSAVDAAPNNAAVGWD